MSEKTKILIVDDDPDIRNVLTLLLREEYERAAVSNGADAIAYMKENPETDLMILDVMMPEMDGIETCEKIRVFSNAPILFLTAKSAEKDRLAAYRSGGDDFLSKPFSRPLRDTGSGHEKPYGVQRRRNGACDRDGICHSGMPAEKPREGRHHPGAV